MARLYSARFESVCSKCGKPILRGQYISWNRTEGKKAYHLVCATPDAVPTPPDPDPDTKTETETEEDPIIIDIIIDKDDLPQPIATPNADSSLMATFATALTPYLEGKLANKVNAKDFAKLELDLTKRVESKLADISAPLRIEVIKRDAPTVTIDNAHAILPKLLYLVSKRHPVLLFDGPSGGPGSGKTTAAMQVVKALSAERYGFISLNPQTPNSAIQGFLDVNGIFRSTVFHDCYTSGGVFIFDEIDHAGGMILTSMNAAIENGHAAFPDGMKPKHPDFILIATANTPGYGANYLHPERRPLDGATRDRFSYLPVNYDTKLERNIALAINPNCHNWLNWIITARAHCVTNKVKCMITPRASYRGADYLNDSVLSLSEIADCLVFRGIDTAVRESILKAVPLV